MAKREAGMHPSAIGSGLFDEESSDMIFLVDGHRVPAHKDVIMSSCEYLRVLLEGTPKTSIRSEIMLVGVPLRGFKLLLSFFYAKDLRLHEISSEMICELLGIAHMFDVNELEALIHRFVRTGLSVSNVFQLYRDAEREQLKEIPEMCQKFMIENAEAVLRDDGFYLLSESAIRQTLSLDTFCAEEIEIFDAIVRWCWTNEALHDTAKNVFDVVRLELIDEEHLLTTVRKSGCISAGRIHNAITTRRSNRRGGMRFRCHLIPDVNLASPELGAMACEERVQDGVVEQAMDLTYGSHEVSSTLLIHEKTGLVVELDKPYCVNQIEVELPDEAKYGRPNIVVRTAPDLAYWDKKVGSFSNSKTFNFQPRVVRYIEMTHIDMFDNVSIPLKSLKVCFQTSESHGESDRVPPSEVWMGPPLSFKDMLGF